MHSKQMISLDLLNAHTYDAKHVLLFATLRRYRDPSDLSRSLTISHCIPCITCCHERPLRPYALAVAMFCIYSLTWLSVANKYVTQSKYIRKTETKDQRNEVRIKFPGLLK